MKTTTTSRANHTQAKREEYESNLQSILKAIGMSADAHFWFKTEIGCQLLEELYPIGSEFEHYGTKHKNSKDFWTWFGYVWVKWESDYNLYMAGLMNEKDYKTDMSQIVHDSYVHDSFYSIYLKQMYEHGKL